MNKDMLYVSDEDGNKSCKLCGWAFGGHFSGCPGVIVESVRVSVNFHGSNCNRGCCGSTNQTVTSDTLQGAINAAARASFTEDFLGFGAQASYSVKLPIAPVTLEYHKACYELAREEAHRVADEEAAEERERRRGNMRYAISKLEALKLDMLPDAYARRYAAILTEYEDVKE